MQKKTAVVPIYTIECPMCGNEYKCVGSEVVDVTTVKCKTYRCSCGYRAMFQTFPSEVYQNLLITFDEYGNITVEADDEL